MKNLLFLCLFVSYLSSTAFAQQYRFLVDEAAVSLREGKKSNHRFLRMIPGGIRVEVLKEERKSGYQLIRLEDGTEGWVLYHQLTNQAGQREREARIAALESEFAGKPKAMATELQRLEAQQLIQLQDLEQLRANHKARNEELATVRQAAANSLAILNEGKNLRERVVELERTLQILEQENVRLKEDRNTDWFLLGAEVLLLGTLFGLLLPKLILPRRTQHWNGTL